MPYAFLEIMLAFIGSTFFTLQIRNTENMFCFLFLPENIVVHHNTSVTQEIFSLPYNNIPEKDRAIITIQKDL